MLDFTLARTAVGRIVFASLCDKLFDIDEKLQHRAAARDRATSGRPTTSRSRSSCAPGVTFHDGEKLDAAAVKFNIERHKTMAGLATAAASWRSCRRVDVIDPATVRLNLSAPFSPLLAQLADRAGMMVSPKAAQAAGDKFGANPVLLGPVQLRRARRAGPHRARALSQLLEQGRRSTSTSVVYAADPRRDGAPGQPPVRASSTSSSGCVASDVRAAARPTRGSRSPAITEIGYQGITINVGNGDAGQKNPLGSDPRVREAFELSLDRDGIVQVAMDGEATVGNQWVRADQLVLREEHAGAEARRRARRRRCCRKRACPTRRFTLMTPTNIATQQKTGAGRAGDGEGGGLRRQDPVDRVSRRSLDLADKGQFEAYVLAWSGRADPDGNI